ncbi:MULTISPECIES: TetR family transcriptional regulator [unclassified Rhizobium]|nr:MULTISPECIES: TetR family transcriptional regulator [unclassified Rhizobium]
MGCYEFSCEKISRAELKARRPHQILEAAFEEFAANGYAATRVEDVARRCFATCRLHPAPVDRHRQPSGIPRRPNSRPAADRL